MLSQSKLEDGIRLDMGLTIGSDPELAITNKKGEFVSAITALKGHGKTNKIPLSNGQAMFYDNVLLEFNIAPSATFREFEGNFSSALRAAREILSREGLSLKQQSSMKFPESECLDPESLRFGCDPEYSIYKTKNGIIEQLQPPTLPKGDTFRSCGGHIHIGHPIATFSDGNPPMVIKMMDLFVGNTALLIDHDKTSPARRIIYGGAGTHRIAEYGVEYRTLSNFWLATPYLAETIYRLTRLAVQLSVAKPELALGLAENKETETIINTGDKEKARALFEKTCKFMSDDLQDRIAQSAENVKTLPFSLEEEWGLAQPKQKPPIPQQALRFR